MHASKRVKRDHVRTTNFGRKQTVERTHPLKALITGATGFIGSHLAEKLLERGYEVFCLIRHRNYGWLTNKSINWIQGNVTDLDSLNRAVVDMDYVFHCGGITKAKDEKTYYQINAEGSRNICEACLHSNSSVKKIVHVGSLAAAGPSEKDKPREESFPSNPLTHYGKSKFEGEKLTREYFDKLPITIIRPPAVYGPREKDILSIFRSIAKHLCLSVGFQEKYFSIVYVDDLVDAIILAGESSRSHGQTYYVDDGNVYTWQEFNEAIKKASARKTISLVIPESIIVAAAYFAEFLAHFSESPALLNRQKIIELRQKAWTCTSKKIREELGFKAQFQIERGCRETWNWYKAHDWL